MSYGERLGQALKAATGKTRVGLAAALNISPQAVGQAVNGLTRAFTAENNAKAAAYLGCSPDWLATGKGPMKPMVAPPPAQPPRGFPDPRAISDEEFELVRNFRDLGDEDRAKYRALLASAADAHRAVRDGVIQELRAKGLLKEGSE